MPIPEPDHATDSFGPPLLVDAHVHLYRDYDRRRFLEGAAARLAQAAAGFSGGRPAGCLLFTESAGTDAFGALRDQANRPSIGGWSIQPTGESRSLVARRAGALPLVLIAGRQLVVREGLELLGLGLDVPLPDGLPLAEALASVRQAGAIPVLPWGFGKWWLGRGRLVADLLAGPEAQTLWLGDNGGRPSLLGEPRQFRLARGRGVPILPGSDPLPFPAQADKVGRYGFVLDAAIGPRTPAADLLNLLRARTQPRCFGGLEPPVGFLAAQLRLRLLSSRHRPAASPDPRSRGATDS